MPTQNNIEQLLSQISDAVSKWDPTLPISKLCKEIIDSGVSSLGAERGFLVLNEEPSFPLQVIKDDEIRGLFDGVIKGNPTALTTAIIQGEPRSIICAPLRVGREVIGALYVDSLQSRGEFEERHLNIAELFCSQVAGFLETSILRKKVKSVAREVDGLRGELGGQISSQERELERMRIELGKKYQFKNIVGRSADMQNIFTQLEQVVSADSPVLIKGEPGTGKELIAKVIHYNGERKNAPFISENCAAISPLQIESELFGYLKGAVPGAERKKIGIFAVADRGTVFLDKIETLNLKLQQKLLRVIKEGKIRPIGSASLKDVDVHVIAATNQSLNRMVVEGTFLKELFDSLTTIKIEVPPLRDRIEDVPFLADHFLKQIAEEQGVKQKQISKEALLLLTQYNWPGNVSELEGVVRKAAVSGGDLTEDDISEQIKHPAGVPGLVSLAELEGKSLHDAVGEVETELVRATLLRTKGNKAKTAKILGISRTTLYEKIDKLGKKSA
ncbi:sigma 54-interacting transcriptional regulator [Bdellovibrionota bacterium]